LNLVPSPAAKIIAFIVSVYSLRFTVYGSPGRYSFMCGDRSLD
jgi:hypothetical protein